MEFETKFKQNFAEKYSLSFIENGEHNMFLNFADKQVRDSMDLASKNEEVFKRIERINESILSSNSFGGLGLITTDEWFRIFTVKMDLLHKIGEIMLVNLLTSEDNHIQRRSPVL